MAGKLTGMPDQTARAPEPTRKRRPPGSPPLPRGPGRAPRKVRRCILLALLTDTLLQQVMSYNRRSRNSIIEEALNELLPRKVAEAAQEHEERVERKAAHRAADRGEVGAGAVESCPSCQTPLTHGGDASWCPSPACDFETDERK